MNHFLLAALTATVLLGSAFCLWPLPQKSTYGSTLLQISDPCSIHYTVEKHGSEYAPDYVE